ncbi:hypothetical protein Agau_C100032 [Agrobacterium tumefaciens F2]|nr:hypothetical protein Agau_C100032 [Agrobacterium tumefaciens F2]
MACAACIRKSERWHHEKAFDLLRGWRYRLAETAPVLPRILAVIRPGHSPVA